MTSSWGITPSVIAALVGVEVVEEAFEGLHPLGDAAGDAGPLLGVDDPGDRVDREGAFLPRVVEGDPLIEVAVGEGLRTRAELLGPEAGEGVVQGRIGGTHRGVGREHLVAARSRLDILEQ